LGRAWVTGNAWEIARIIETHVARVIVVSPSDTGTGQARAKTDRLDARALAKLLWAGELDGVWTPDERIRAMRRRLARRAQLVRARTRAKNEVHAALMRCLKDHPPAADLFGVKGRRWLADQHLAVCERETVDSAVRPGRLPRQRDRCRRAAHRRRGAVLAGDQAADDRPRSQRDRRRQLHGRRRPHPPLPRPAHADRLPRTRSARAPVRRRARRARPHLQARIGQRPPRARGGVLVDRPPTPPGRRFYQRIRARREHSIAIVASARKLACLFRCLLIRGEDYAFAQPSLTKKKMRRLELKAGARRYQGGRDVWSTNDAMRHAERELALQAQRAYERTITDRQAAKAGASATPGRASSGSSKEQVARQTSRPKSAL
jgi:transposase